MNRLHASVRDQLADPAFRAQLRAADVVVGVNALDPSDTRVFYGGSRADLAGLDVVEVVMSFDPDSQDSAALLTYLSMSRGSASGRVCEDWN